MPAFHRKTESMGYFPEPAEYNKATHGISNAKELWRHTAPLKTPMFKFMMEVNQKYGLEIRSYEDLHRWSVTQVGKFWGLVWDFVGVKAHPRPLRVSLLLSCPERGCLVVLISETM